MSFLIALIKLGLANLWLHRLRSFLTALGIILGVAAVITMVAIGEGSKQQALLQLERLGAKNIIIRSQRPPDSQQAGSGQQQGFMRKYGITRADLALIRESLPEAEAIVPLKEVGMQVLRENRKRTSQAFGVSPDLKSLANLSVARGRYLSNEDVEQNAMVVVIGSEIAKEMFPFDDPMDQTLRIDAKAFKVIGVLSPVGLSGGAGAALVGRDLNLDVHLPLSTAQSVFGDRMFRRSAGQSQAGEVQVSEVYIGAPSREQVMVYSEVIRRIMESRHPKMEDIGLIVPYELLEKAKRDALTWNIVLSSIASISLLVGGIGIMNIMLASVTERTREIGIRRALGATRKHIIAQFLVETGVLSALGGLVGILLGVGSSLGIGRLAPVVAGWLQSEVSVSTQITTWSIFVAFGVAAATGLIFGIYPAMQAAKKDPIVALRHD